MRYEQFAVHDALAPWVECVWHLTNAGTPGDEPAPHRIFPDGCLEIVIHGGAPFLQIDADGQAHRQATRLVVGQMLRAGDARARRGASMTWGVRLHPWGARRSRSAGASHR